MLYNIYLPIECSPILLPIYLYIGPTNFVQNGLQGETEINSIDEKTHSSTPQSYFGIE
jgi:hypothetical protein